MPQLWKEWKKERFDDLQETLVDMSCSGKVHSWKLNLILPNESRTFDSSCYLVSNIRT